MLTENQRLDLAEAVERGAARLDDWDDQWADKIDLDRLDLRKGAFDIADGTCGCIAAQLDAHRTGHYAGRYGRYLSDLFGDNLRWIADVDGYGFDIPGSLVGEQVEDAYDLLNELWTDQVEARR